MATSETSSSDHYYASTSSVAGGDIKRSNLNFSEDEEALMIRMYNLVGARWSLIAGRIPGRTAEEIKSFWMTRCASRDYGKRK